LLRVGIIPKAEYLYNKEAKRIADENDFLHLNEYEVMPKFGKLMVDELVQSLLR
jgi:hypothetical protein